MASGTKSVQTTQSSTTNSQPWDVQRGYLGDKFWLAKNLYANDQPDLQPTVNAFNNAASGFNSAASAYTGAQGAYGQAADAYRTAAASPLITQAQNTASGIAANGGLNADAQNYYTQAARGDFLTQNNPYFQRMVDQSIMAARPSIDSAFAGGGRLGSGAHAAAFADAATRQATQLGYNDYSRERGLQANAAAALNSGGLADAGLRLQAGNTLPTLAAVPAGLLGQAASAEGQGAAAAGQAANALNLGAGATQTATLLPSNFYWGNLGRFSDIIGAPITGTTSTNSVGTQPVQQSNPWLQGAGLGIAGLGALSGGAGLGLGGGLLGSLLSMFPGQQGGIKS